MDKRWQGSSSLQIFPPQRMNDKGTTLKAIDIIFILINLFVHATNNQQGMIGVLGWMLRKMVVGR